MVSQLKSPLEEGIKLGLPGKPFTTLHETIEITFDKIEDHISMPYWSPTDEIRIIPYKIPSLKPDTSTSSKMKLIRN